MVSVWEGFGFGLVGNFLFGDLEYLDYPTLKLDFASLIN